MPSATSAKTLAHLSRLAGQQFGSLGDATQAILETITDVLNMRTSWVASADFEERRLSIDATHNEPGGCDLESGKSAPLEVTFCANILYQDRPAPLIVEDVRNDPRFENSAAARVFSTVGSYVGVPIILSDGTIHGTLCACDPEAAQVTPQQAQLLSVLSRLLATQIELDNELVSRMQIETRFQAFMDNTPAVAYMKDQGGKYVYANQHWYDIFEHEPGWIIGKTDDDFLDPGTAAAVTERDRTVLQVNSAQHFRETSLDSDGQPKYWHSIKFPVRFDGDEVLLGGVSVDITESHKVSMQRALLAAIVSDTQDAIFAKTLDGVITAWNPAAERLYGYSSAEMVGNTLDILVPDHMESDLPYLEQKVLSGERVAQHETWRQAKDGTLLNVELTLSLIRDADGEIAGVSTIARDITEHMRLVEERNRLYSEMQKEVARAAVIQNHLLPRSVPLVHGFEFGAICRPAREVGGDFYDWVETPDGVRLTLADVMGKGMSAALLMATTRAVLRGASKLPLDEAMTTANQALMGDLVNSDAFVTMFHAELSADGRLTYTDAGHGLAVILRADGSAEQLRHRQLPIGVLESTYYATETQLNVGDTLIVYSDGLIDACPGCDLEDPRNIVALCEDCADVNGILAKLEQLSNENGPRPDDLTLLGISRTGELS